MKIAMKGTITSMTPMTPKLPGGDQTVAVDLVVAGPIEQEGPLQKRLAHANIHLELRGVDAQKLRWGQELTFVMTAEDP